MRTRRRQDPEPTEAQPKINLLLVDDRHSNLLALEAVLTSPAYNLIFAHGGPEAIELIKKNDIALILLDVQMPGMDGFETLRELKAIESSRDIPVILITAFYRDDPFIRKGYQAGAVDYFSKPFDPEILKVKVELYSAFHQKRSLLKERERHLLETERLLKAGQRLAGIMENLPVGVLIVDLEGRVCQANAEAARIWGFHKQLEKDAYGEFLSWWEHGGRHLKAAHSPLKKALESNSTHNDIAQIRCFDGTTKTVLNSASPLHSVEGKAVGVVLVIQDVTEQQKIEKDMVERIQKLLPLEMHAL